MIANLSAQLAEVGLTIDSMYTQLTQQTAAMKELLEVEERLGAEVVNTDNPAFRGANNPRMQAMPDFAKMMEDPEAAALFQDPEVLKVMQRCLQNPELFVKEAEKSPKIRRVVEIFMRNMGDDFPGAPK